MRCLTCHYSLEGLPEHRCPECGRNFDPNNSATFDDGVADQSRTIVLVASATLASTIGIMLILSILPFIVPVWARVVATLTPASIWTAYVLWSCWRPSKKSAS